jgi:hypothetical protein
LSRVEKAWISTGPVTARVGERLWKALYVEDAIDHDHAQHLEALKTLLVYVSVVYINVCFFSFRVLVNLGADCSDELLLLLSTTSNEETEASSLIFQKEQ